MSSQQQAGFHRQGATMTMNARQNDVIRQVTRALDEDGEYSWFYLDDLIYDHGGALLGEDEFLEVKEYILAYLGRV